VVPSEEMGLLAAVSLELAFVVPVVVSPCAQIARDVIDVAMMLHMSFLVSLRFEMHHARLVRAINVPVMVYRDSRSLSRSTGR
jgi:hypothetical protein